MRFVNWNEGECIVAQNDSIVWVGTKVGLVKWNIIINSYETYDNQNGLPSTAINDLVLDNDNNLWMATDNGIVKYDGNIFELFNYKNLSSLPKAPFIKIITDSINNIYAALGSYVLDGYYNHGGLVTFSYGQWKTFHGNNNNFSWHITDMIIYNDSLLICLPHQSPSWDTKFYTVINNELIKLAGLEIPNHGMNFTIDHEDSLWLGCGRFLYKYRNHSWIDIINGDSAHIGGLWKYAWSNGQDGLWLGGYPWFYYINIEANRNGIHYSSNLPPGVKKINEFEVGFSDNLELSGKHFFVSQNGLSRLINFDLQWFQIPKTIDLNEIYGLGISPINEVLLSSPKSTQKFDGENWISIGDGNTGHGTWNNDFIYSPNGELFTNVNPLYSRGYNPTHIMEAGIDFDGTGNLWTTYPVRKFTWPQLSPRIISIEEMGIENTPTPQFMDIIVDKFDHVWAAGSGYIAMFDGTQWHPFSKNDVGVPSLNLDYAFADSKGRKWFSENGGTPNWGLIMYDEKDWTILNFPALNRGQYIFQIAEDHFGNLWYASQAGLLKYNNTNWFIYNYETANVDFISASAVTVDQRGNIWVGTNVGLFVFNPLGIDLNSDISISPADSLKIKKVNNLVTAEFKPSSYHSDFIKYELQFGIKPHKFWTVNSIEARSSPTDRIEILDSTLNLGSKVYRIKAIDSQGRAFYSPSIDFQGNSVGVTIHNFIATKEKDELIFKWTTENENYVSYYEIFENDTVLQSHIILKRIKAQNNIVPFTYRIVGKNLSINSQIFQYSLNAVFADSSRSEVKTLEISPTLPKIFQVSRNYPNPFNNSTKIDISNPYKQIIKINIYNILGELVFVALEKEFDVGYYNVPISFSKYASGIYIFKVIAGKDYKSGKMILIK